MTSNIASGEQEVIDGMFEEAGFKAADIINAISCIM
jgi:hypothetical protein